MANRRRVVRPRIVRPSGLGLRIFTLVVVLAALVAAFLGGAFLGYSESVALSAQIRGLEQAGAELEERVSELRQQNAMLERSQQIDREANRSAREQLRESQERRLELEKEVSFLRRLFREGGGGILQVKDFSLEQTAEREFAYRFTVTQLVPDFGWSEGSVEVRLVGREGEEERSLTLAQLEGSEPTEHRMRFQNFQSFEGQLRLPDALDAERLVVEVKPKTKNLIPASETFPWPVTD